MVSAWRTLEGCEGCHCQSWLFSRTSRKSKTDPKSGSSIGEPGGAVTASGAACEGCGSSIIFARGDVSVLARHEQALGLLARRVSRQATLQRVRRLQPRRTSKLRKVRIHHHPQSQRPTAHSSSEARQLTDLAPPPPPVPQVPAALATALTPRQRHHTTAWRARLVTCRSVPLPLSVL